MPPEAKKRHQLNTNCDGALRSAELIVTVWESAGCSGAVCCLRLMRSALHEEVSTLAFPHLIDDEHVET